MDRNGHIASELHDLQDQKSLMLHWCSISESGRVHVAHFVAYTANHYRMYEWPQPIATDINNDASSKMVDTAFMPILSRAYPQHVIIQFSLIYQ